MDTQGDGVKNVNERDDLDVDMWNTRSNTGQRRRPRPNPTPTEAHSDAANTSGVKRVKGARCQSSDVFLELNHSLLSSKLYLWGRHRRMRLPASLRMCFPAPKVHFLPPFAKQCTAQAYYAKYRQQCEEVHSKLVESQYQTPPHDREPEGETKDKSGVATSEQTSQERKSNEEKTKGDSREEGRAQGKIRADADLDDVPTLDLLRSLPRSAAAKLIIEECGADPETVETFLRILDSTELVVGLHPDQATEPLIDLCLALDIPFAVVPCCIFANVFTHRAAASSPGPAISDFSEYLKYLVAKDPRIKTDTLPCPGRNTVLYFIPESAKVPPSTTL